jgi:hypothetical protein
MIYVFLIVCVCVCVLCFVCVTEVDFLIKFEVRATNFFVTSVIYYLVPIVSHAETALFHICDYVALDNGRAPVNIYNIMNTLYGFVLIKCYNIKEKIKIIINIIFILHKRL